MMVLATTSATTAMKTSDGGRLYGLAVLQERVILSPLPIHYDSSQPCPFFCRFVATGTPEVDGDVERSRCVVGVCVVCRVWVWVFGWQTFKKKSMTRELNP